MLQSEYDAIAPVVLVREVFIKNHRPGFRVKSRVLVSSFLEASKVSKVDLAGLYNYRWFVELSLRSIKDTMSMDILRGKTAVQISFKLALQTFNAFSAVGILSKNDSAIYLKLLESIACKTVGNRPGRKEPRRTKRRPKPFSMLQKARGLYKIA